MELNNKNKRYFLKYILTLFTVFVLGMQSVPSQIAYDHITNKAVSVGSYGRIGVDWSIDDGRTIGRRLNLNNMVVLVDVWKNKII
jgi:maltoporin